MIKTEILLRRHPDETRAELRDRASREKPHLLVLPDAPIRIGSAWQVWVEAWRKPAC